MDVMRELKQLVTKELEKIIQKGTMSPAELNMALDAVRLVKEIDQVEYMESYEDEGYSGYDWPRHTRSRDMGYSGHSVKDRIISRLERMMDETSSDYERQTIRNYINDLRG